MLHSDKVTSMIRNSFLMRRVLFINPDQVIHVGADKGQDRGEYLKLGVKRIVWLEADPENVEYLNKTYPDDQAILGIVTNENRGKKPFYLMKNSALSSIIPPLNMNSTVFEKIIFIDSHKLDSVIHIHKNNKIMLVIDVQGAEEQVIDGAQLILKKTKFVIIEIAQNNMGYTYQPSFETILGKLAEFDLKPSIYRISHDESYKDVLFVKGPSTYLLWINWLDKIFDRVMRIRHFMRKKHFPKRHYYCESCRE